MSELRKAALPESSISRLRVGIKWDPLERDDIGDAYGIESADEARAEMLGIEQGLKTAHTIDKFLRMTVVFRKFADKYMKGIEQIVDRKEAMKRYLEQADLPSYDLDLCCLCYDASNKMVKFISPVSSETKIDLQKKQAFMHTGDATTGTSGVFDEQLLVDLNVVDANVDKIFFIAVSVSHGFHDIKGGYWAIVSTKNETELMSSTMETDQPAKFYVMAKVTRDGGGWILDEVSGFCNVRDDKKVTLQRRIDASIAEKYLGQAPASNSISEAAP